MKINKISFKFILFKYKFTEESEISFNLGKESLLTTLPEILNGESYNNKSDIWNLGIIIYVK